MLNRRHIRIKVLQILYAYYSEEGADAPRYEKMLFESIYRFRDMYVAFLQLLAEVQTHAIEKIEAGMNKRLPTPEDLNPNTKFAVNALLLNLSHSQNLERAYKDSHLNWSENRDLTKRMFKEILDSPEYEAYMQSEERGFAHDKDLIVRLFKKYLVNHELMHDFIEDQGIFWNDDLDLAASMVLRSLKAMNASDTDIEFLPLWKDGEEEEVFCRDLFRKTLVNGEDVTNRVAKLTPNWDLDRIALMDLILIKMAAAEAMTFESIPLKVSMNEYIELSKFYSTNKSATFINGVLDNLIPQLKEEGKIHKVGRGLIE
ncbi:MAG: transcription antitermination protein NusB [Bacteroidetes bacterium]|nr:transcription antitermination protein NusB [Bacteroidota bacterium]